MIVESQQVPAQAAAPAAAHPYHPPYRPDIDGLRAIAVLSVMVFHAFPGALRGGFAGVDLFFVISGFLIGSILIVNLQRGTFTFADFYARRIRRIFPALFVVTGATLAFGWFALFPDELAQLGKHVLGGAGFVANFVLWNEVGYFDTAAETKPLLHLWSLGIEEQFYIFWPVLLLFARRRRRAMLLLALGLGLASFLVNIGGLHKYPSATFYSPASRVWELLAGAALAWVRVHGCALTATARLYDGTTAAIDFASPRARNVQSIIGALLVVGALLTLKSTRPFPGWSALLPVSGAVLLIAAGPQAWINRHVLSNRHLVGIGLISYPLYLWHWPLLSFAQIIEAGAPARSLKLACLGAAVVLAWLTWQLVERPLRGTAHGRAKVAGLAAALLALAAAGAAIWHAGGVPDRAAVVDNKLQQQDLILVEDRANAAACKARYGFASPYEYCQLDDVTKAPTVVLIGDSHAYHLVAGQTAYWRARGENVLLLGTAVPFFGYPDFGNEYQKATPKMLDIALGTPSVRTVVISTAMLLRQTPAEKALLVPALRTTLEKFTAAGREVIFVTDNPTLGFEPRTCIRRAAVASSQTRTDCSVARKEFDAARAANVDFAPVLKDFPQVKVFDPASALCDAAKCRVLRDDALLYRDTHHLSYRGDLLVGEAFARWHAAQR
ncbi:acyltransferase family protein [uncultured Massilia sp.]|uniref:acyltransferase family protein n=1 Tax=uncultured Massilia sp. TaxID=169973 RepID=UPI0025EFBE32|nr:acyltransferase family protein [uncultured Massilia sp.]